MLKRIIEWSVRNKFLVLIFGLFIAAGGILAMRRMPLEALPDLSDVQVIVRTDYAGQAPQIVEDQVTYPIASEMLKVPGGADGPRLLVLRDLLRLHHLRRRHGPVLGPEPGARVPVGHPREAARRSAAGAGPRRHRAGVGLPVRAGGHHRHHVAGGPALVPGLVPALPAHRRARRERGGLGGRLRAGLRGHRRPHQAPGLRHPRHAGHGRHPLLQRGRGRHGAGAGRAGVHDPRARLPEEPGGHRERGGGRHRPRHAHPRVRRGGRAHGARRAPGRGGPGRARRRGGRHRHHALRRERPGHHRPGEGQAGGHQAGPAQGAGGEAGLRPLGPHPPRHRHPQGQAPGGVHRGGAGHGALPGARAERAGGDPHAAPGDPHGVHRHADAGARRRHHEPGRHRHRHRRDDRRRDRHDREHAQAPGARHRREAGARQAAGRRHSRRRRGRAPAHEAADHAGALGRGRELRQGGRPRALLLAAHHHGVVPAGVQPGGPGGPAVQAAGLDQDAGHGGARACCR